MWGDLWVLALGCLSALLSLSQSKHTSCCCMLEYWHKDSWNTFFFKPRKVKTHTWKVPSGSDAYGCTLVTEMLWKLHLCYLNWNFVLWRMNKNYFPNKFLRLKWSKVNVKTEPALLLIRTNLIKTYSMECKSTLQTSRQSAYMYKQHVCHWSCSKLLPWKQEVYSCTHRRLQTWRKAEEVSSQG